MDLYSASQKPVAAAPLIACAASTEDWSMHPQQTRPPHGRSKKQTVLCRQHMEHQHPAEKSLQQIKRKHPWESVLHCRTGVYTLKLGRGASTEGFRCSQAHITQLSLLRQFQVKMNQLSSASLQCLPTKATDTLLHWYLISKQEIPPDSLIGWAISSSAVHSTNPSRLWAYNAGLPTCF